MKGILLSSIIDKITTLKDRSVKVTFQTQELSPATAGELFTLQNTLATIYISPAEITTRELQQVDVIEVSLPGKRPSERMRNVLFILWKQDNEGYKEFDFYYVSKMDAYIDQLKQNIKD